MLLLTRRVGETIVIGQSFDIEVTVLDINRGQVKIGVNAPREIPVHRGEIANKITLEKLEKLENLEQEDNLGE